jgi:hypothetical protein
MAKQTIFTVKPHRGGWRCIEAPGVQPYFTEGDARESAIRYAMSRTAHRRGEIRVLNASGEVEQCIPFDGRAQRQ